MAQPASAIVPDTFVFGAYRFIANDRMLYRGCEPLPLPPKAALLLLVLLRNTPRLVEKDELLKEVWPDTFVEEGNLAHHISLLRKALGNGYIDTVPRRGYRFVGQLELVSSAIEVGQQAPAAVQPAEISRPAARWSRAVVLTASAAVIVLVATLLLWRVHAKGAAQSLSQERTRNQAAFEEFLKGRMHSTKHDPESLRQSVAAFERAIELDHSYADAYAALAEAYLVLGQHESTDVAYDRMRNAATTAIELDPKLPQAHAILAFGDGLLRWRWAEAEAEFRRAIQLDPNYTQARIWFATVLMRQGRTAEALQQAQRALSIEPFHEVLPWLFANIYYHDRQYDQALEWIRTGQNAGIGFGSLEQLKAQILALRGECGEAVKLGDFKLDTREQIGPRGYVLARCGRDAEARELKERLLQMRGVDGATTSYFMAMIDIGLHRNREALRELEVAYEGRSGYLPRIKMDPVFDPIRHEARFQQLLKHMRLIESDQSFPEATPDNSVTYQVRNMNTP